MPWRADYSMKIGELAKKAGCQVVTVRYYEKEGLLETPERSEGNYRIYTSEDLDKLRFIRHCRLHGINLSEIRELLAFRKKPTQNCEWINTLIDKHIKNLDEPLALAPSGTCPQVRRGSGRTLRHPSLP